MAFEQQQAAAMRILSGIEDGVMSTADSASLVEDADPALVHLIFTWIRKRYADNPDADAVIARLLAVIERSPRIPKLLKEGQADPIVEWFEEEYSYRDFSARDFIALIVEKLEG